MLLETFEGDGNSLIVYSRNILNSEENFRMVFKKDTGRLNRKLYLYDICGLINNKVHKNLIVYRLLTNQEDLLLSKSQMGCFISTSEGVELVYSDPIYAVKELEEVTSERYLANLKFRIQQVGFITSLVEDKIIFNEVFHFDLDSLEAQAQNDAIFVEGLLKEENRFTTLNEYSLKEVLSETKESVTEKTNIPLLKKTRDVSFKTLFEKLEKKNKSAIGIFNSPASLDEYMSSKKKKKIIFHFLKH